MNMGLVMDTGRHTAFDSTVVFHEYMHGVTHRLVGGAMNDHALDEPQSKAMGEGWGDYIACTVNEVVTVGHWVKRRPEGIRSARYDDSYPGRYGNIGTGLYTQAHRVGEIWCATLLQLNRNLDARLGAPQGRNLALQLVVDALKLSPANPNMLDMRDAILRALDSKHTAAPPAPRLGDDQYEAAKAEIWKAFAKFGMGANARSAGAKFDGVVGDSTLPAGVGAVTPSPSTPTVPTDTRPTTPTAPLPGGVIRPSDPAGVAIPDDSADGVTRTLTVTESGPIKRIAVHVDIEHAYPGDLEILLVSPGGTTVRLYNRAFKAEPTLVREFRPEDTPALAGLVGKPVQGAWNLKVMDRSPGETGRLRSWSLEIELAGAAPLGEGFEGPPGTLGLAAEVAQAQGALRRLLETLERLMTRLGGAPG
jgi:extracellular elastinolytic metalloproteinase